jgi:hypothetical protein
LIHSLLLFSREIMKKKKRKKGGKRGRKCRWWLSLTEASSCASPSLHQQLCLDSLGCYMQLKAVLRVSC